MDIQFERFRHMLEQNLGQPEKRLFHTLLIDFLIGEKKFRRRHTFLPLMHIMGYKKASKSSHFIFQI